MEKMDICLIRFEPVGVFWGFLFFLLAESHRPLFGCFGASVWIFRRRICILLNC